MTLTHNELVKLLEQLIGWVEYDPGGSLGERTEAMLTALRDPSPSGVTLMPNEATTAVRQAIFNYLMGDEEQKESWWGTSDQVEHVNGLYRAMLAVARKEK